MGNLKRIEIDLINDEKALEGLQERRDAFDETDTQLPGEALREVQNAEQTLGIIPPEPDKPASP